jgi:hypothetical protein
MWPRNSVKYAWLIVALSIGAGLTISWAYRAHARSRLIRSDSEFINEAVNSIRRADASARIPWNKNYSYRNKYWHIELGDQYSSRIKDADHSGRIDFFLQVWVGFDMETSSIAYFNTLLGEDRVAFGKKLESLMESDHYWSLSRHEREMVEYGVAVFSSAE